MYLFLVFISSLLDIPSDVKCCLQKRERRLAAAATRNSLSSIASGKPRLRAPLRGKPHRKGSADAPISRTLANLQPPARQNYQEPDSRTTLVALSLENIPIERNCHQLFCASPNSARRRLRPSPVNVPRTGHQTGHRFTVPRNHNLFAPLHSVQASLSRI